MMAKRRSLFAFVSLAVLLGSGAAKAQYVPSPENLAAREDFQSRRLGIFLHWGIYSAYAQGEWYLSTHQLDPEVYSNAAAGFFPSRFNAAEWAAAFKDAGAGYVTLTSRHHDGFSMFRTAASPSCFPHFLTSSSEIGLTAQ